ncbi:MAG: ORF6N domain-containing protein, partial [Firmicutes bacterium]|nr:ORF6N domain-containing protein [Bacillota bacterium]
MEIIKLDEVKEKIITVRDERVILDSDVAALYGVETREINQAIKNNP